LTKNCKRVCLANALKEIKIVANLKNKMIENKECQWVTKAICNAGKVLNMNIIEINKHSTKLKNYRFKIPHYA
jgi:thymidine phosphorylase